MTNMTLSIPEDLYEVMQRHSTIKWSEVARQALWNYAKKLELMNKLVSKSKLTEEDGIDLGRKIKKGIALRHGLKS